MYYYTGNICIAMLWEFPLACLRMCSTGWHFVFSMTMQHWFVLLDTYSNMHYMITGVPDVCGNMYVVLCGYCVTVVVR